MAKDSIARFRLDRAPAATGGKRTKAKQTRRKFATDSRRADLLRALKKEINPDAE